MAEIHAQQQPAKSCEKFSLMLPLVVIISHHLYSDSLDASDIPEVEVPTEGRALDEVRNPPISSGESTDSWSQLANEEDNPDDTSSFLQFSERSMRYLLFTWLPRETGLTHISELNFKWFSAKGPNRECKNRKFPLGPVACLSWFVLRVILICNYGFNYLGQG